MATRRAFLRRVAAVGGWRATYLTMQALGLLAAETVPAAQAAPAQGVLPAGGGHGTRVVILGAGVAGLSAAYELGKAGYACTVLEARDRVGGRNWTIRRGTRLALEDGTEQTCTFDPGHYWNAGPARLPSHHQAVLGYCRELGVALEVEVNTSRGERLYNPAANGGRAIELRQVVNDVRGEIAELLDKAIDRGALDQDLTKHDKERMAAFLKQYGDLDPDYVYRGSTRSGYRTLPGPGAEVGVKRDKLPLGTLLDLDLWSAALFEEGFDFQATMFQPVGGIDHIPMAFARTLGGIVRLDSEVQAIWRHGDGVEIVYRDRRSGQSHAVTGDYCLVTLPLPVLRQIPADFGPAQRAAIAGVVYGNAVKVAWQAPRFWETENHIYGGISWVAGDTSLVWYPSDRFFTPDGIVLGAYAVNDRADRLSSLPLPQQFEATRAAIEALHPGRGALLTRPMAIAWSKVPWSRGIAARWPSNHDPAYALLGEADGPFYFAGEHLSHIGAWQEGAILSARRAIGMIDAKRREKRV